MVNVDEIYGNQDGRPQFLKADLCTELKLWNKEMVIDAWEVREFENFRDDGTKYVDKKIALTFQPITISKEDGFEEFTGMLVLNMTNKDIIKEAYGTETEEWVGKPVKLLKVKRKYQNKLVDAMQVDIPEDEDDGGSPSSPSLNDFVDPGIQAVEIVADMMRNWPESEGQMTKDSLAEYARGVLAEKGASQELKSAVSREITGSKRIPTE